MQVNCNWGEIRNEWVNSWKQVSSFWSVTKLLMYCTSNCNYPLLSTACLNIKYLKRVLSNIQTHELQLLQKEKLIFLHFENLISRTRWSSTSGLVGRCVMDGHQQWACEQISNFSWVSGKEENSIFWAFVLTCMFFPGGGRSTCQTEDKERRDGGREESKIEEGGQRLT